MIGGVQVLYPSEYGLSGASMSISFVAVARRESVNTGAIVLRNLSDSTIVTTLAVSNSTITKLSQGITIPDAQKTYEVEFQVGTSDGIAVAYVGFQIDRTF